MKRILLVEDEISIAELQRDYLEISDFQVDVEHSGETGLQMALQEDYDLIIGPTAPTPAFKIGDEISDPITMYMNDVLTIPVNLAGLPGMSIPAGFADGMPVGLQLIGKSFDESTLYKAGYAFEQATDFHQATPDLGGQH